MPRSRRSRLRRGPRRRALAVRDRRGALARTSSTHSRRRRRRSVDRRRSGDRHVLGSRVSSGLQRGRAGGVDRDIVGKRWTPPHQPGHRRPRVGDPRCAGRRVARRRRRASHSVPSTSMRSTPPGRATCSTAQSHSRSQRAPTRPGRSLSGRQRPRSSAHDPERAAGVPSRQEVDDLLDRTSIASEVAAP